MTDFEREVVSCLNHFFKTHHIVGFAYRTRQHKDSARYGDVLTDSPYPSYTLSIACRSIIDKKLYFSQHFHKDRNNVHQVEAITNFLARTGRSGFLAVEFRQGTGEAGEAFLIPWAVVVDQFKESKGITLEDARTCIVLARSKDGYRLESLYGK